MATIKEIAELAGVSRGTVDRVLNNRGAVNKETEKKILEIAKQLDYRPNKAGIVLAAQKKKLTLGVILFSTENPFFADVLDGVKLATALLADYKCRIIVKEVYFDIEQQLQALNDLEKEGVNGIAIAPCNHPSIQAKINDLYDKGIPVVTLNTDIDGSKRIAYVGSHYMCSGRTAAGLVNLVTGGSGNIGIISGSPDVLCHTERIAGFRYILEKDYPQLSVTDIIYAHDDTTECYEKTKQLLTENPHITALYFAAGGTIGGCRAVKEMGLSGKIKVIGYDMNPTIEAFLMDGTVTAMVCQNPQLQGSRPLEILFNYLTTGEQPKTELQYMDVDIRIKENLTSP